MRKKFNEIFRTDLVMVFLKDRQTERQKGLIIVCGSNFPYPHLYKSKLFNLIISLLIPNWQLICQWCLKNIPLSFLMLQKPLLFSHKSHTPKVFTHWQFSWTCHCTLIQFSKVFRKPKPHLRINIPIKINFLFLLMFSWNY